MPNGDTVANISLALNERYKTKDGEIKETVEYIRIVFYRRQAEICEQYLKKGSKVYVEGKIQTRKWQDQNGQERYLTEIIGNSLQMLDSRQDSQAQANAQAPQNNAYANAKAGKPVPQQVDNFEEDSIPF
ncbi:single-stranded DNA-binding protein [Pasteurella oralis]